MLVSEYVEMIYRNVINSHYVTPHDQEEEKAHYNLELKNNKRAFVVVHASGEEILISMNGVIIYEKTSFGRGCNYPLRPDPKEEEVIIL